MGTRINVLLDHRISDYRDRPAVISQLAPSLPAAFAVHEYWRQVEQKPVSPSEPSWKVGSETRSPNYVIYNGPGSLFLSLSEQAARIRAGGRWRGFLSIEPLRRVHLQAFRAIAHSLGSTTLAYFHDNDFVDGLFWDGESLEKCTDLMHEMWGPPQASVELIAREIERATEHGVPSVWYLESIGS